MSSITPLSALPARNVTPAGTVTISNTRGRLTATLTSGGAAKLLLISRNEGGYWYFTGEALSIDSQTSPSDATDVLDFVNDASSSLYHVVADAGSAAVACYLSGLVDPATSTALVAHASTHLAGGADDLLGSPGTIGGTTPGVFCGTVGPDASHQNTVPSVNGDVVVLRAASQTLTNKTLTAPVVGGGLTASGSASNDFSASTGTFKTSTGAVTIGGGAAAISATSSAAAITLTAGAASTWSTSAGALNVDGFSGINLKINGSLVVDVGATSASKLTLAAGKSLSAAAGASGLDLGNATGDSNLPTGALGWAGAANKNLSLVASGTGTVTIDSGGAANLFTSTGTTVTIGRAGQSLVLPGAVTHSTTSTFTGVATFNAAPVFAAGLTASGAVANDFSGGTGTFLTSSGANTLSGTTTIAANKNLLCAAGTTAVDLSLGTGTFKPPTGLFTFQGAVAATASAFAITDPGNAGAIPVTVSGVCNMTSAGAETRTLAIPTFVGQEIVLNCDTYIGNIVVTSAQALNQAGNTVMTFNAVRDNVTLKAITIGGAKRFQIIANDGVALS